MSVIKLVQLTASTFQKLAQYDDSPAELAVSSLAAVITIASTHFTYPSTHERDEQADLAWES